MKPYTIPSIRELHQLLELSPPKHPLVSVIDFTSIKCFDDQKLEAVTYGFYCIALKKNFKAKMRYGQQHYDFDIGVMSFFAPHQVVITEIRDDWELEGHWLVIHPDFLHGFPLLKEIRKFGFFYYAVNEALLLSEEEDHTITQLLLDISEESQRPVDPFSQTIVISQIELLLNYCNRFYNRQFLTRKQANSSLVSNFETLLEAYFNSDLPATEGIPGVGYFAGKMNLSRNYLSDMLRNATGQSAQHHIQQRLIERAIALLSTSELNVSEIAYQLGFEYPQSFNKLFRNKMNVSPLEFRASFLQMD
ncbi:helix-turn-helix domain-containing protein [Anditalea andensis]|uniref:AraC family transcriptional regulator n=1 Tax=Anditalea andensis TaxID=1048983 RepID=A0A074LNZ8_9BACT|nr:AraC family transcriptional regulator [Anditalea andensis]KEO75612.1 AraC family transcriptional regulator [Anditalea andensis]